MRLSAARLNVLEGDNDRDAGSSASFAFMRFTTEAGTDAADEWQRVLQAPGQELT